MAISNEQKKELRELALKATQGQWVPYLGKHHTFSVGLKDKSADQIIAWKGFDGSHELKSKQKANCKFIAAANPEIILQLLSEVESMLAKNSNE